MGQVHGGRLVAKALKGRGVTAVFTLCGNHVEAIYDGCLDENIRVIDTRHEQTAGFAADASARLSGIAGVAIVSAGPGISNSVTALANAKRAGVPMVLLAATPASTLSHRGASQELDGLSVLASVCKWSAVVPEADRIEEYITRAFRIALGGCPGPVYLEMPVDILKSVAEPHVTPARPIIAHRPAASAESVTQVAELLQHSEKPIFIVGSQLRWSTRRPNIASTASHFGAPFFLNGLARGSLPFGHSSLVARCRRQAMAEADLIVLVGTPIDFRLDYGLGKTWNDAAKLVHVNLNSELLGENRSADIAITADAGLFLQQLASACPPTNKGRWMQHLRELEASQNKTATDSASSDNPVNAEQIYQAISSRLAPDDIVIGDGGEFVSRAVHGIDLSGDQIWLDSGPYGALGIGPGFALAASIYRPNSRAVILAGDGTFGLSAGEFEALSRHGVNAVCVVGNNGERSRFRRIAQQQFGATRTIGTQLSCARYEQVVAALGGRGYWVENADQLTTAFDSAFDGAGPACVNVQLAPSN